MTKGFTLIEFLMALALLALLGLIGGATLQIFASAMTALPRQADNTMLALEEELHQRLGRSFPLPSYSRSDQVYFAGHSSRVDFAAFSQTGRLVFYSLQEQGNNLYLNRRSLLQEKADDLLLVTNIKDFQLRYLGSDDPFKPPQWQQNWQNASLLPLMVKVKIEKDSRVWSFQIPLALSGLF